MSSATASYKKGGGRNEKVKMIKLENISFSYDDTSIIDRLDLNIEKGEWVGLLGPNGAGKTTLLKLISGALCAVHDAHSHIYLDDKPINSYSRKEMAKLMAVVPQDSSFTFSFTALEIVLMGRAPYLKHFGFETAGDIEIARDAMEKTDTWQFRERKIDQLSGGERQRVIVARALAQGPKILLLDEPTSFLDLKHQINIMDIISELNRNGITIISALHDVNLAISYCGRIALLNKGKIVSDGSPKEIVTYANLKEVFNADVYVGTNEFTGMPYYVPMGSRSRLHMRNRGQETKDI